MPTFLANSQTASPSTDDGLSKDRKFDEHGDKGEATGPATESGSMVDDPSLYSYRSSEDQSGLFRELHGR